MATLYVTEYSGAASGPIQIVNTPKLASNNVAIGGSSAASNPFSKDTSIVRVHTDVICSIAFSPAPGATPTATTADARMAADQTEYFAVKPGDKIAVISNT